MIRAIFHVVLALVACLAVSTAIRTGLRALEPGKFPLLTKVVRAAADPETNVVFFGTSRIERGIIPDVFDRAMQEAGVAGVHSHNLADGGESVLEAFSQAAALFDRTRHRIKFAVVEPDLTSQLVIREPNSLEAIEFFTLTHGVRALQLMAYPGRSPPPSMPMTAYVTNILKSMMRHYFNIGLAVAEPEPPNLSIGPTSRGFPDLDEKMFLPMKVTENFSRQVETIGSGPPQPQLISDSQIDMVLSLISYIQSEGAVPILVRPPQLAHWDFADAFAAKYSQRCAGKAPPLFNFSSPTEYAALYDPRDRMDEDHLNAAGAAIFSTLVAQRLAQAIRDGSLEAPLCR